MINQSTLPIIAGPRPGAPALGHDDMVEAYMAGAFAVHEEWHRAHSAGETPPRGDPEFRETATDWADGYASRYVAHAADMGIPTSPAPAMEAEPVAWLAEWSYQGRACHRVYEYDPSKGAFSDAVVEWRWTPLCAHPQDAESLRATEMRLADAGRSYRLTRDERDAALARVAEVEATADRLADALRHALWMLPRDCNQRLGMEGALRAYQPDLEIDALTPQPDAGLEALVETLERIDAPWFATDEAIAEIRSIARDAITALRARPVGEVWQDIATAPMAREQIIVAVPDQHRADWIVGEAYYDPEAKDWFWAGTSASDYFGGPISEMNHWLPELWHSLPAPSGKPARIRAALEGGEG